jgi:hypothetical protein
MKPIAIRPVMLAQRYRHGETVLRPLPSCPLAGVEDTYCVPSNTHLGEYALMLFHSIYSSSLMHAVPCNALDNALKLTDI